MVGEGIPKKYVYKIEGSDKNETITKEVGEDETPESHTFDNLTIGEEYTVKVYVTNSTGKTTKEETKTEKTTDPTPTIDLTPTGKTYETSDKTTYMTSGKVTITYPSNEYKNYYRWDDWEDERFEEYAGEIEAKNGMITAIVKDGEETISSSTQTITTIDTEGPTITKIEKSGLKVTIQATDTLSGVKEYKCGSSSWKTSNECEFEEEGTYEIKVRDNLLNENPTPENVTVQLFDENNGSQPVLGTLTPVVYDGSNWIIVSSTDSSWSDYANQKWGNAVLLRDDLEEPKEVGDPVTVEGDNPEAVAMFVWIPRYEYKIEGQYGTHYDGAEETAGTKTLPGEIEVKFISKDTVYENTNSEGYRIHPAFTFGTQELDGIWVGKFETSHITLSSSTTNNNLGCSDNNCENADGLRILPSVKSLRYNSISNMFYASQSMDNRRNIDGDLHMMKNSEWGAVAYLSQSKYGKYGNPNYEGAEKHVRKNNCQNYITGVGANSQNEAKSTLTCTSNRYTTAKGQTASTTGNITGIYDMSGGACEYVMGIIGTTLGGSGFTTFPESKYYDNYTTTDSTTACDGICYGHALSETSGWYGDGMNFLNQGWAYRGGILGNSDSGVFAFSTTIYVNNNLVARGYSNVYASFRIVLAQT